MNQLILAIGVAVVSACCVQASDVENRCRKKLGAIHAQIVLQHMRYVKTDSDGRQVTPADIDAAKLNLIQTHKQFKNLLDRQRINDAPITDDNEEQYSDINTQVIFKKTDKIIWEDDVVKYVIDAPQIINSFKVKDILNPKISFVYISSLQSGDDAYVIYFIRDRKFFKDFTVENSYSKGINGGFFMFKLPIWVTLYNLGDKIYYTPEYDGISVHNPAYILVDDNCVTSPVSNIKDDTKIRQSEVNKVLARRVVFRNLQSAVGLFDADKRNALRKVFDEVCGPNHGNRFLLDEDSKIEMAKRAVEEKKVGC